MNIVISHLFSQYFSGRIWMGLDYELIKSELETKHKAEVTIIPFQDLKDSLKDIPKNTVLFYSSIYNQEYLKFIQDTILYISLKRPDIVLIPNQHQLNALENKGYQELYKDLLGIEKAAGKYYGDIDEVLVSKEIEFPFVLKKLSGALSSGVQLIKNRNELEKFRTSVKKRSLKETAAFRLNKRNSFKKDFSLAPVERLLERNFDDFFSKRIPVVVQEFIPDLECDYKVLVFGDKYFVFRRETRENDFRASGSGMFSWVVPPFEVLNVAKELKEKFKVPYISFDLGIDAKGVVSLFEYQGTAFGPIGATKADKHFIFKNENWEYVEGSYILEVEYAYAINHFINENP